MQQSLEQQLQRLQALRDGDKGGGRLVQLAAAAEPAPPEPAVAPRGHAVTASAAGAAASAQPPGKRPTRGAAERAALLSQAAAAEEVRLRVTRLGRDMSNTFCSPGFFTVRRSDCVRQQRRRCIT